MAGQVLQGAVKARRLIALVEAQETGLPETMPATIAVLAAVLVQLDERIAELDVEIARCAFQDNLAPTVVSRTRSYYATGK